MKKLRFSFRRSQLVIPYALFLVLFVILPLLLIVYYAFTDANGNIDFQNFIKFFTDETKINTLIISLAIGALNTLICLLIGYPLAYLLANNKYNKNKVLIILFMMPMWINFVLRTAATRDLLTALGIMGGETPYLTVMIGMVYNYLPFVILPLYNTMTKLDKSVIEASSDLGAKPYQTFFKTIIPMSMPGIVSAAMMVFMPTMSSYVISDVLGERKIQLLGNLIQLSFDQSQWNNGSTIALIMLIIIGISMLLTKNVKKEENTRGGLW
jgi:spermidine/putrescine transport system permease protein